MVVVSNQSEPPLSRQPPSSRLDFPALTDVGLITLMGVARKMMNVVGGGGGCPSVPSTIRLLAGLDIALLSNQITSILNHQ